MIAVIALIVAIVALVGLVIHSALFVGIGGVAHKPNRVNTWLAETFPSLFSSGPQGGEMTVAAAVDASIARTMQAAPAPLPIAPDEIMGFA